ncbi:hypothetical protein J4408_02120 [Candidatus Pacearchaeota archaeon]|nr:hypothetical protein [Candidatus Pacearchaeota archaeon]
MNERSKLLKYRILFFSEAVSLAHVGRPLKLAKYLAKKGFDVYFAVDGRYNNLIDFDKKKMIELKSQDSEKFKKNMFLGKPLFPRKLLEKYIEEERRIIRKIKPDLVVGDFRPSLKISCKLENKPFVNVTSFYWSKYYREVYPASNILAGKILGKKILTILLNNRIFRKLFFRRYLSGYNLICRKYGLDEARGIREAYHHGDYCVYSDIKEIYDNVKVPKSHAFIGPIIWEPEIKNKKIKIPRNKRVVYLSFGSSGEINQKLINFLNNGENFIIVVTGRKDVLNKDSKNVVYMNFAKASEFLKRADLAINNGGSAGVYQALSFGVPILGIPSNMDQFLTMEPISKAGLGDALEYDNISLKELNKKIKYLGSNRVKENLRKIKRVISQYHPEEEFYRYIRKVLGGVIKKA